MTSTTTRVGSNFGHYQIRALLGRGGMGEVYEAYDTVKDRTVALKILSDQHCGDETFRERFRRESHTAAKLQEPHVVPIHDWGDVGGSLYIDMRLVDGVDLRALLRDGPVEPDRAVAIVSQVAAALDGAHAAGLIHRDVKPENVILTPADFAYLVDFGIAEAVGDTRLTSVGTAVGSFAYMAPERFGNGKVTAAADIYALACVLYELLTGSAPFPSKNLQQVITAHATAAPPRPSAANPAVPATLDEVIARGMAKQADDRYGTAGAFARAAQRALKMSPNTGATVVVGATTANIAPVQYAAPTLVPQTLPPPPSSPNVLQRQAGPGTQRQPWVLPALIAAATTVIVAGLGVTVLMLSRGGGGSGHSSSTPTVAAGVTVAAPTAPAPTAGTATPQASTVTLPPDARVCPSTSGPAGDYRSSAAGSQITSCQFAEAVRMAYGQSGPPSATPRVVTAFSPVTGQSYQMTCTASGPMATCTGGNDAVVYVY